MKSFNDALQIVGDDALSLLSSFDYCDIKIKFDSEVIFLLARTSCLRSRSIPGFPDLHYDRFSIFPCEHNQVELMLCYDYSNCSD